MSDFTDEIKKWIDQDGLIGSSEKPTPWSSGNPLLESSIAVTIETLLSGRDADKDFIRGISEAISRCEIVPGVFDKNPNRPDQITHDDLKGIAAASRICGMPFARNIVKRGEENSWDLTNTGFPYWDAFAKPWDQAFYKMCASLSPSWDQKIALIFSVLIDSYKFDPGDNRLTWLSVVALEKVNPFLDLVFAKWRRSMKKKYGTVGGMMFAYYRKSHPFVKFGEKISF